MPQKIQSLGHSTSQTITFIGSPQSGWKAALLYTLTRNCARLGIDPNAYFRDVLERLPTMTNHQVESLLPDNWQKERSATAAAA